MSWMCLRHVWKCKKTSSEKDAVFLFKTTRLSQFNRNLCCEGALYPAIYSTLMRGRTGNMSFCVHVSSGACMIESIHAGQDNNVHVSSEPIIESIHASQDNNVRVSSASMIESIHAGQDYNVHGPSASMIESIHAGQDKNVHVSRASMIESIHAGQDNNVRVSSTSMFPKIINLRKYFWEIP